MRDLRIDKNLELRLVDEKYAAEAFEVVRENYDHLHQWMPWANKDYSLETARGFFIDRSELNKQDQGADYSIFLDKKLIGGIGFNNFDIMNRSAEIGYWLAADRQGLGIITKSCRTLLDYGFRELGLNRIKIKCATANLKSRAIPERLGFIIEGTSRQAEFLHDRFVDLVVYSMLAEDWGE